ncbi:hypothetical protein HMI54_012271 [Coelomomyces lativittatus]|nr:hypothetical protein HMI56_004997 [Coelomomyces lativittatus]KAJ1498918.1 hypothetical protein HMI54_012271 [Coelomomyces lativittatus]
MSTISCSSNLSSFSKIPILLFSKDHREEILRRYGFIPANLNILFQERVPPENAISPEEIMLRIPEICREAIFAFFNLEDSAKVQYFELPPASTIPKTSVLYGTIKQILRFPSPLQRSPSKVLEGIGKYMAYKPIPTERIKRKLVIRNARAHRNPIFKPALFFSESWCHREEISAPDFELSTFSQRHFYCGLGFNTINPRRSPVPSTTKIIHLESRVPKNLHDAVIKIFSKLAFSLNQSLNFPDFIEEEIVQDFEENTELNLTEDEQDPQPLPLLHNSFPLFIDNNEYIEEYSFIQENLPPLIPDSPFVSRLSYRSQHEI